MSKSILLCTVGTSLLSNVTNEDYRQLKDPIGFAAELASCDATERICGAEINSIASMISRGYISDTCAIHLLHSDTEKGEYIAQVLATYFKESKAHQPVTSVRIDELQDADPKRFRTKGLRNLARKIGHIVRDYGVKPTVINATGGYKAQIAVAVLFGQALSIPVYYKHELFDEIIAFPPMPIAFDYEFWMRMSEVLTPLSDPHAVEPADKMLKGIPESYIERVETLLERDDDLISLSPVGQVFYESFLHRFTSDKDCVLPPPVPTAEKRPPKWEDSGHMRSHPKIFELMQRVTNEIPQVAHCRTDYYNPDLAESTRFRLRSDEIEGVYSNGTFTVKFIVETSASTEGQKNAVIASLNLWLQSDWR